MRMLWFEVRGRRARTPLVVMVDEPTASGDGSGDGSEAEATALEVVGDAAGDGDAASPAASAPDGVSGPNGADPASDPEKGSVTADAVSSAGEPDTRPATSDSSSASTPRPAGAATRTPAEAFADLAREVGVLRAEMREVVDYVRRTGETAMLSNDEARRAGASDAVLDLRATHHTVCQLLWNLAGGSNTTESAGDDPGVASLLALRVELEQRLRTYGVEAREPRLGDPIDIRWMDSVGRVPGTGPEDAPDTIARVTRCGYFLTVASGEQLIERAAVVVFSGESSTTGE